MQRQKEQTIFSPKCIQIIFLIAIFVLLQSRTIACADELISCRYQQSEGRKISLQLNIGTPPPSMLILVQKLPEGVNITSSTPTLNKYNPQRHEAKWLLKHLLPGEVIFTIELDKEIGANMVSGEIRYKNPTDGKMIVMSIKP